MTRIVLDDEFIGLVDALQYVDDPRVQGRCKHKLIDILVLSVCASLCGADGISEIEEFGIHKQAWLARYLELPAGIPSHDTIARVLSLIDGKQLEEVFTEWVRSILIHQKQIKTISIDGKTTKGTVKGFNRGGRPIHVVSAYSHELGLCLTESQSGGSGISEVESGLACLRRLNLKGVTVMADAGLNSSKVVNEILRQEGNYLMPLKGNHKIPYAEACQLFSQANILEISSTVERQHGRLDTRNCRVLPASAFSLGFHMSWSEVKSVFCIERVRESKDKRYLLQKKNSEGNIRYEINTNDRRQEQSTHYYVSNLELSAEEALMEARKHWLIENQLHWVLDVAFGEDSYAVRAKALARTLSLIRKFALNLIRKSKTSGSVRVRMKRAAWNDDFLGKIIFGT